MYAQSEKMTTLLLNVLPKQLHKNKNCIKFQLKNSIRQNNKYHTYRIIDKNKILKWRLNSLKV